MAFLLAGGGWGAQCLPHSLGLGCRHSEEPNEDAAHTGLWQCIHLWPPCSDKPLGSAVAAAVNGTIHHGGRQASQWCCGPPKAAGRAWTLRARQPSGEGCVPHSARTGEDPEGVSWGCAVPQHKGCCCSVAGWVSAWPAWLAGRQLGLVAPTHISSPPQTTCQSPLRQ